jgi:hypothetical protein
LDWDGSSKAFWLLGHLALSFSCVFRYEDIAHGTSGTLGSAYYNLKYPRNHNIIQAHLSPSLNYHQLTTTTRHMQIIKMKSDSMISTPNDALQRPISHSYPILSLPSPLPSQFIPSYSIPTSLSHPTPQTTPIQYTHPPKQPSSTPILSSTSETTLIYTAAMHVC